MWTVDKLRGLADTMDQYDGDVPESMGTGLPQTALRWSADQLERLRGGLNETNTDLLALIDIYEAEREQFRAGIEYLQADLKKAQVEAEKLRDLNRRIAVKAAKYESALGSEGVARALASGFQAKGE